MKPEKNEFIMNKRNMSTIEAGIYTFGIGI